MAVGEAHDDFLDARCASEAEVGAGILGGEVTAAGVQLANELPSAGKGDGDLGAGSEGAELDLEPVTRGAGVTQQNQAAVDRVDRHVHVAVVVVVGCGETAAVDSLAGGEADERAGVGELPRTPLAGEVLEHLDPLRVLLQVHNRNRAVGEDQVEVAVEVEVGPRHAPAGVARAERRHEVRPSVGERGLPLPRGRAAIDRMELSARVRHEQILAPVEAVVAGGDSHAGVGVVDADGPRALLEPEAEPGGVGLPGDVEVQPVRVQVVCDVEVEPAVRVDVREDRPETVVEPSRSRGRRAFPPRGSGTGRSDPCPG